MRKLVLGTYPQVTIEVLNVNHNRIVSNIALVSHVPDIADICKQCSS